MTNVINLRAGAGDGQFTILRPTSDKSGCAYVVDLGSSDAAWNAHCNDVTLTLIDGHRATVKYASTVHEGVPYWSVENTATNIGILAYGY